MADTPKKATVVQTAKAGGVASTLILALTQLPDPYSAWVGYALIAVGAIGLVCTQIPAPPDGSKLWPLYRALSFVAANWGQAVNAGMLLRKSAGPSAPPLAGPGSVVTIFKDTTK
ncbi:hypothetical protein K2X14_17250 [Acetobacter sp. TBRC 12305]|uniref:Uncharacterized protein n=1 Tax=Acetobacter garciniae TaxID=2817435 RepID=A0A939HRF7_9PROT|nr:hypothetical protein [Acetobacter garciniae]MBO1326842.1 hypothetical protein [Acetobacter garciniae]MBX0346567.1 hypothetical protein [Acetobacter garciniae]